MSYFVIRIEDNKSHTLATEWGSITGIDAELAVAIKQLCQRTYESGYDTALSVAESSIRSISRKFDSI